MIMHTYYTPSYWSVLSSMSLKGKSLDPISATCFDSSLAVSHPQELIFIALELFKNGSKEFKSSIKALNKEEVNKVNTAILISCITGAKEIILNDDESKQYYPSNRYVNTVASLFPDIEIYLSIEKKSLDFVSIRFMDFLGVPRDVTGEIQSSVGKFVIQYSDNSNELVEPEDLSAAISLGRPKDIVNIKRLGSVFDAAAMFNC